MKIKLKYFKIYTKSRKLKISSLSQINRWKHKSGFVDHVFEVRFEFRGLDHQEI